VIQNIFALKLNDILKLSSKNEFDMSDIAKATREVFSQVIGGYSVIGQIADCGLFAFRDPQGLRPLVMGKKENPNGMRSYIFASESVALEYLGYEYLRDLKPGELVYINKNNEFQSEVLTNEKKKAACMFEWIYFSSPESRIEEKLVYRSRLQLGKAIGSKVQQLISEGVINPDVIIPVPETSRIAAIQCAEDLKLPYREILIKNRYVQRSFILNSQDQREEAVKLKLSPVPGELEGKRVLIMDC